MAMARLLTLAMGYGMNKQTESALKLAVEQLEADVMPPLNKAYVIAKLKEQIKFEQDLIIENSRLREKLRRTNKKVLELQKRLSEKHG